MTATGDDPASSGPPLLSIIILTRDEEANLPYCLESLRNLAAEVFVVDSGSADLTAPIARGGGARVVEHAFENQARQINWALQELPLRGAWTMRLDADERLTPELVANLPAALRTAPAEVTAFEIRRRVYFWGRWIRHGGYYPTWLVRVWRTGKARCEDLWMDEHIAVLDGETRRLSADIIDENRKGLSFWIDKHNNFSDREVKAMFAATASPGNRIGRQAAYKRFLKRRVYGAAPRFARALLYWLYRYICRLGFLDGRAGFVFHFLQAFWYRLLVDAKLYEAEQRAKAGCDAKPVGPLEARQ